jgi:GNAT superfamily N-acetyltransferase
VTGGEPASRRSPVPVLDRRADGYEIRTDGLDVDVIHRWLSTEAYWALGRSREVVVESMRHCECYGVFTPAGELVGFARALTDHSTFAWIADVFVDTAHRGRGLGTWLVGRISEELRRTGVPRQVLATMDAHGVYTKVGFAPVRYPERWMEIDDRPYRAPTPRSPQAG